MNISSTRPTAGSTSISSGYSSSRMTSTSSSLGASSVGRSSGSSYLTTGSSSIGTGSSFGSRSVKESIGSGYSNMYKSVSSIGSKIYQSFLGRAASRRYWSLQYNLYCMKVFFGQIIYIMANEDLAINWSPIKLHYNSLLGTLYIFINYFQFQLIAYCLQLIVCAFKHRKQPAAN